MTGRRARAPDDLPGASFHLRAVGVRYPGAIALHAVDLAIAGGEAVAFVGPSGAGKTTLLRTLAAAIPPTAGHVALDGVALAARSAAELRALRASIGFIHQDLRLVPNLRVVQNVIAGRLGRLSLARALRAMLFPRRADVHRVHEILERVGIPEKLYERTDRLSGGQQQRVAIARALFQEPRALLADEPISSVDPARARDTLLLLRGLAQERRITLLCSLHNLELARELFPRLVGVRAGAICFDRPAHAVGAGEFHALYALTESAHEPTP